MNSSSEFKPVITKASLALQKKHEFKALVFEEPKLLPTPPKENNVTSKTINCVQKNDTEFDIKKARHEVLNFAINNQRVEKNQKKMLIYQLVKLGAKPPKKAYKNYKDLVEERKRLKDIREQRKKFHQLGKNQTGAASVKCRSKTKIDKQNKKRPPVASIDQHYGIAKPKLKKRK